MRCDRFEREGLLCLERGEPLAPHFEECPDCRVAREEYRRLASALADAGSDLKPPPHWQDRVWSRIARRRPMRRPWWTWALAAAVALVVVAVGARLLLPPTPAVGLVARLEPGDGARRGDSAQVGDRLRLEAHLEGATQAELRVYRDDAVLVLRCSDQPPCVRRGERLEATLDLSAVGSYLPLLLVSDTVLTPPTGHGLDADSDAALAAGARLDLAREIRVR